MVTAYIMTSWYLQYHKIQMFLSILWDFSNSKYLGQEKEVFFVGNDSNHIKMIDKDAILDFSQDKDHLLLKRLQTPLQNIDFGNSFEYLKFPFSLNDSLTCQIEGKGTYCSKNKMELSGTCCHQNHQIFWILHFFEENWKKTQKYLVISNIPFIFAT